MQNICILIPANDEEKTIGNLVRGLLSKFKNVIIVDDGSSDRTAEVAKKSGAIVLRHTRCLGKGAALRTGYDYCLSKNFDIILNLDSDGQHDWRETDKFIDLEEKTHADIIIGNRMGKVKNMPWIRFMTNRVTSKIISALIKQKVEDTQSGYRLIKSVVLRKVKLTTAHYDTESELLIKAGCAGFKIVSVPIETIYRKEKSRINRVVDTARFIRLIWRSFWWAR